MNKRRIVWGSVIALVFFGGVAFFLWPNTESSIRTPSSIKIPEEIFVKNLDRDLGESFEENDFNKEKQYITQVVGTFIKFIREVQKNSANPLTTRGAHAKALACLKGRFEIDNQLLPPSLRVGLFAQDKTIYKSWIRISNSSQDPFSKDKDQNTS